MTIVTYYNNKYRPIADITLPVMKQYGRRHGYEVVSYTYEVSTPPQWEKLNVILKHLPEDDVFWLDVDSLIVDMDFKATRLFLSGKDLSLVNGSSGYLAIKKSAIDIIQAWKTLGQLRDTYLFDQATLYHMLQYFSRVDERVGTVNLADIDYYKEQSPSKPFLHCALAHDGVERAVAFLKHR